MIFFYSITQPFKTRFRRGTSSKSVAKPAFEKSVAKPRLDFGQTFSQKVGLDLVQPFLKVGWK